LRIEKIDKNDKDVLMFYKWLLKKKSSLAVEIKIVIGKGFILF